MEARAAGRQGEWRGSGQARAGETRTGGERQGDEPSGRGRLIVEQVGLTEAQKAQVDSIVAYYRREMRNLQDELQTELQATYATRSRGLIEETRVEIKRILTPQQRTVYDSLLVQHDQRRGERRTRDSISEPGG